MREIKFRALGTDGQWWYGEPTPEGERHVNLATFFANLHTGGLNPETCGQYTGLKDKKGSEIYEGDILADTHSPKEYYILGKVTYSDTPNCINAGAFTVPGEEAELWHLCEVIGNIYENPELMEG